jgi:hypothetical protein
VHRKFIAEPPAELKFISEIFNRREGKERKELGKNGG